jgi:uncharacterized protein YndB with AHSA1/START domain
MHPGDVASLRSAPDANRWATLAIVPVTSFISRYLARGEIEMINVEVSTVINRPVADVFAFVANFENHPKWETDFQEVKLLTVTPAGIGTTYDCLLKFPGQSATSKFEITEYAPDKKIAYEGQPAGPAKPKRSFLFESAAGGTKVTALPQPEFRGLFKLLEPMMAGYIRKNNVAHLNTLKRLLEA